MDQQTLNRLRPAGTSSADISDALDAIRAEQLASRQRLVDSQARRQELLFAGTTAELRDAEQDIRDAELDELRLAAMLDALEPQRRAALAAEAGERLQAEIAEASATIDAFNRWFAANYIKAAQALRVGLELERKALRAKEALQRQHAHEALPAMSRAYVGGHAAALGFYTRLPGAQAGEPVWWAT